MNCGGGDRMEAIALHFLLSLTAVVAVMHPEDYLALQSLRKSLSDLPGSTFLSSWDFTSDPCSSFPGVLCSSGRVVALSLGDPRAGSPGLSGHLDPSAFPRLSSLSSLSLVPGRVSGPLPPYLPPSLRFLALSANLLSGKIPAHYILPRLRTLDLSSNLLYGQIPTSLLRLPSLSNLVLAHNRLSATIPPSSSPLLRLDLRHNLLSGPLPPLPRTLNYLALSGNLLSGRVDRVLPSLPRLAYLDLSINRFSGPIPACIFSFPISVLQLQRNAFSGVLHVIPPLYPAMERVDLSHNQLVGAVPAALAAADVVYLNNNLFFGEVPSAFGERVASGGIRLLYLQHNYLTRMAGIGAASKIPPGTSLCLQYNCMVLPAGAACPLRAGKRRTRPAAECSRWRKGRRS